MFNILCYVAFILLFLSFPTFAMWKKCESYRCYDYKKNKTRIHISEHIFGLLFFIESISILGIGLYLGLM